MPKVNYAFRARKEAEKVRKEEERAREAAKERFLDAMYEVKAEDIDLYKSLGYRDENGHHRRNVTGNNITIGWWRGAYRIKVQSEWVGVQEDPNESYPSEDEAIWATIQQFEKVSGDCWRRDDKGQKHVTKAFRQITSLLPKCCPNCWHTLGPSYNHA